ncbi:hypothetical protein ACFYWS_08500 [Streptomyces sp. NPDC002795]|uniref:effector-associated constant component EACC1 n=1 Tax=Streptomyces sp. NPDC002795 TaxID=3364665 RepID=UPI003691D888
MRVRISSESNETLRDLYVWLRQDDDVRRTADVRFAPVPPGSGTMGVTDYINVVCSALSALLTAYSTWRATRPSAPPVQLNVNDSTVVLGNLSPQELRRIAERLEADEAAGTPPEPGS